MNEIADLGTAQLAQAPLVEGVSERLKGATLASVCKRRDARTDRFMRLLCAESSASRAPAHGKSLATGGAVAEIQVDECLVRDAALARKDLEVSDGFIVEPDGDLAL